jgi:phosphatidylserine/phosphatidylglycerophosphate/cardiolipin synthase-like enzyme
LSSLLFPQFAHRKEPTEGGIGLLFDWGNMRILAAFLFVLMNLVFVSRSTAALDSFDHASKKYSHPQIFSDNDGAFAARIYLLDHLHTGATVKIATFNFDYGQRVQELAVHLCRAVQRGVKVELLVDSKSGDRVDVDDAFDSAPETKKSEEIYSYLATCGAQVYIHNSIESYVTFFGSHLPNVFSVPDGSSVGVPSVLGQLNKIKGRLIANFLEPFFASNDVQMDPKEIVSDIQSLAISLFSLSRWKSVEKLDESPGGDPIEALWRRYRNVLKSPFWSQMDAVKAQQLTEVIRQALLTDKFDVEHPGQVALFEVFKKIRMFNRLNHRKLFLVEEADKSNACAFIGGRNLGDKYLLNSKDSFHDGDVLVCAHHLNREATTSSEDFFKDIHESFNELRDDTTDPILGGEGVSPVRKVLSSTQYRNLLKDNGMVQSFVQGTALVDFSEPKLLVTGWVPAQDDIRFALLRAIEREQNEIYIETAYAEFNGSIRRSLENALKRGVKVTLVTNGLFISDGASKFIRIWMRDWVEKTKTIYPKNFFVYYATLDSGHMIHFKGAGFRCQRRSVNKAGAGADKYWRTYLIGSHNFHPRSGYSDKEHALQWNEVATSDCEKNTPPNDLVAQRKSYYNQLSKAGHSQLMVFPTLYHESHMAISYVNKHSEDSGLAINAEVGRAIMRAMYQPMGIRDYPELLYIPELERMHLILDDGGFRDLMGLFL